MNSAALAATNGGLTGASGASPQQSSPPKKASKKSLKMSPTPTAKQPKSKAAKAAAAAAAASEKSTNSGETQTSTPTMATATSSPTPKAKKEAETVTKKHATKPQSFKISREKERKEKQLKQAAALSPDNNDTHVHAEPDAVKSRNHRMVLAPSRCARDPCWSGRQTADGRTDSVADRLHDEILEYTLYTRATVDAMGVHIEQMMAHVRRCVLTLWPASKIEPFGSYATGIWLPSSDVDLVILGVVEIHDRSLTIQSLRTLAHALESQPWVESLVVLDTAKIPVLKLVTAQCSVPIDITFESSATHSGLLARDLIKRYADDMPELYPLAVVFKQLLRERDLNDAYTGGLSSYSIVLMIIHFQLLWRYGDRCFRAAAVFASGSPLPRPADLIAEEARQKQVEAQAQAALDKNAKVDTDASTKASTPTITSSFAAVVSSRPTKGLKRPASEAGKATSTATGGDGASAKSTAPAQPFSYAAVAAGIVKLSTEDTTKAPAAPVSYAAAVAAPPQVATARAKTSVLGTQSHVGKKGDALDAVSVTSSMADTEDCSDGTSSTTASAHEDADHATSQMQLQSPSQSQSQSQSDAALAAAAQLHDEPVEISLGERTMTILEFFGIVFDYRKNGLSIRDGGYIYRLADHVGSSGDLGKKLPSLVIEDPIHPDRNVSASSFAFSKVVAVFEDSFYALKYFRPSRFTPSALSCLLSTSGHSQHQYQQQFHHLLASKKTKTPTASISKGAVAPTHKGVAIAAK